jgi:BCD family chlorophyll transporter-like MFS transporter
VAGQNLDPYSPTRLVAVTACVAGTAFLLTLIALFRLERNSEPLQAGARNPSQSLDKRSFLAALRHVWADSTARRFTVFVFASMIAYSAQDLILEPFAGAIFGYSPGESTKLTGWQHGGVFLGMLLVGFLGSTSSRFRVGTLRGWAVAGCIASAVALAGLSAAGFVGPAWPLRPTVFLLGVANGAFAVAAIGTMMELATSGPERREGVRMGVWGAAQGVAFGLGGFLGTVGVDVLRAFVPAPQVAYASVFAAEAALFLIAANLAAGVRHSTPRPTDEAASLAAPTHGAMQTATG